MELSLDRLTKHYKSKIAVDCISATMTPGVYGLLGANGAGKTTLMRMLCGILEPTSGAVLYNGHSIFEMGNAYRNLLGYLPQEFGYYPNYTAQEFLLYISALKGIPSRTAKKRSRVLLETVGLENVATKKIKTFSGGMKQRLGIAQALLNNPKILVLDEPTAGLDPKERVRLRNILSDFASDKIVLLSTHIVSDIEAIADEVFLMKKGTFILKGSIEEIVSYAKGKVWELTVPEHDLKKWELQYTVANLHHSDRGFVTLRIVSDERPSLEAIPCMATLEDLYLSFFPTEDGGAK
ncbi:MAG: ABC transporter ATP-binding protein [Roseburia faecis]